MRALWLVLVAAVALASARRCTPGSLAELASTLKPVVAACEDAECSPECRELIAAPTTVTKQAKRCIVAIRAGHASASAVEPAVRDIILRGQDIVQGCKAQAEEPPQPAARSQSDASPSPAPSASPAPSGPPKADAAELAALKADHDAAKAKVHALGGRVAALERAAGRKDTGTGKAAQQTLAAVDAQTDAVADAANAAVEEGVKDITALADQMEEAQRVAVLQQKQVKSKSTLALEKALQADEITAGSMQTQEAFVKDSLRRAAEQTKVVEQQVADATKLIEDQQAAGPS
ncbi:hypothetical protein FNF27_06431 [Cafeteria roenbergensis]|uniref:Uncharacterized protein n=1 Tax=Cafeteria roenbergensis TaxID=33653 RepID=A0A5A8CI39_CAFRO|nr:hypothetical protein FNF29_03612 [Cafeteria roenbergensis]KAA0153770.1 hypothetical protein FNF28_06906 [Cafeteria roenbergensis]KAA0165795.1 hypothetical protein FNF31_01772 [Cafeteria roenbergensis]KAA0170954.1 hypothetical protein FNF27_06431 [Cafeteria roenbergensis]|eukprot:KAA0152723.1 hypothetical protein FNF29_03612 [Cafeteria roenbergensis]